ncbi:LOW QUALITY PROTEIN: signal transduction histidine kinase [Flavobacteriaceae bacterium MAR_2009_75]|nr:LOW QUALITY PROTEIN: signal transduction histidine kinase [Flavobacteriaceae bacterium MAR_2009_75]
MKFRYSIVTRFALFFTGLLVFCILLTGYLVFKKASGVIVAHSQERVMHTSELAELSFFTLLNEVSKDIAVISASPTLQNYVNDSTAKTAGDLKRLFRITLENKTAYFQIRLIGIENDGREVVRFDKNNGEIFVPDTLQQKGDLNYFQETVTLNEGEFYFSRINLNEEFGVISNPRTPTVRAASPIFNTEGNIRGILVINVNLGGLYRTLEQISGTESRLYLIDSEGQYLYAPETTKQFGLQTQKEYNFFTDFRIDRDTVILQKDYFGELKDVKDYTYLSTSKELSYFQGKRKVYLISLIEQNVLLQSARAVRSESIKILLWVCVFSILISLLFVSFFSRKIDQVTKAISNYDKGITDDMELPTDRKDEIGVLANTFTKMKTKIDRNVEELNAALKKEQHAKKQRDEFLQNMSHEMRTPLNTILGLTQLLHKQSPKVPQLPIINSLEKNANNLAGLMYDVLDHQKLVEGKLRIAPTPTNIAELLKDIHSNYEYEALQKGLDFRLDIDKQLEVNNYVTDPLRLSQIVTNLVVNALKYTPEGKVGLRAKVVSGKAEMLEVKITDTGIGILPENLAKINERFFREKEDLTGRYGGYGLGLSIVRQLTELFGGTLKAVSEKGSGSEFFVMIPIIASEAPKNKIDTDAKANNLPRLSGQYKVLYIEDDPSTVELMRHILDDEQILLYPTDSMEKASDRLDTDPPDLIISDLMLEDSSLGPILTEWIKRKKISCPLILASALEPEIMGRISTWYFQKPFNIDDLKDTVYRLLGAHEFMAPDFSTVYTNYDNDSAKISKVLQLLREEFGTYLDRMKKAENTKDQKEWDAILHKLIAHINNLQLTDLQEVLPQKVIALKKDDLSAISNIFAYYLCCIRCEESLNSKDRSS